MLAFIPARKASYLFTSSNYFFSTTKTLMPSSNLRFVSKFFFRGGGRSFGSRRNFSSPSVKKDVSNPQGTIGFTYLVKQVGGGLITGYFLAILLTGDPATMFEEKQRELFKE